MITDDCCPDLEPTNVNEKQFGILDKSGKFVYCGHELMATPDSRLWYWPARDDGDDAGTNLQRGDSHLLRLRADGAVHVRRLQPDNRLNTNEEAARHIAMLINTTCRIADFLDVTVIPLVR